jgi:hypothetical protein
VSLRWRLTRRDPASADLPDTDGIALDDAGQSCGRVYLHEHMPMKGLWAWSMTAQVYRADEIMPISGKAATKEEAKAAVEACYARAEAKGMLVAPGEDMAEAGESMSLGANQPSTPKPTPNSPTPPAT